MGSPDAPAWSEEAHIEQPYPLLSETWQHHDMDAPLCHYFISSGHNSYLTADQLRGEAGTSTIIRSLQRACRVIELDCYNGSSTDGPICKHGGTATKPVLFKDCVKAIKEHAFVASAYPVVVTLENHTDAANQAMMVRILKQVLGDALYLPTYQTQPNTVPAACKTPSTNVKPESDLGEQQMEVEAAGVEEAPGRPADESGRAAGLRVTASRSIKVVGQQILPALPQQWLSPNALKGKFLVRCKLNKAIDELVQITYIPITKFQGLGVMNALTFATSSSINESKLEAMVRHASRTLSGTPVTALSALALAADTETSTQSASSAPAAMAASCSSATAIGGSGVGGLAGSSTSVRTTAAGGSESMLISLSLLAASIPEAKAVSEAQGMDLATAQEAVAGTLAADLAEELDLSSSSLEEEAQGLGGEFALGLDGAGSEQWTGEGAGLQSSSSGQALDAQQRQGGQLVPKGLPPLMRQRGLRYSASFAQPGSNAAVALAVGLTAAAAAVASSNTAATSADATHTTATMTTAATTAATAMIISKQLTLRQHSAGGVLDGVGPSPSSASRLGRLRAKASQLRKGSVAGLSSIMKGVWGGGSGHPLGSAASASSSGGLGVDNCKQEMLAYTNRHLLRVYPASWRVSSKNYRPSFAWAMGASCAALNWQRWDKSLWINQGKFMDNGGCGYVKKPSWMLDLGWDTEQGPPARNAKKLQVRLYSACMMPGTAGPTVTPADALVVKMEVWGEAVDYCKQLTMGLVLRQSRLPIHAEHQFQVKFPETAVLLFSLRPSQKTSDSRVLGYFALPLASLKPGSYKLGLLDLDGKPHKGDCWIKVHLGWEDPQSGSPSAAPNGLEHGMPSA